MIEYLRKIMILIYDYFYRYERKRFTFEKRKNFLEQFNIPKDYIEASRYQYIAQMSEMSSVIVLLQNLISTILLVLVFIDSYRNNKYVVNGRNKVNAIYLSYGIDKKIIPESLKKEFVDIKIVYLNSHYYYIGKKERELFLEIFNRYWYSPFFCLKNFIKIGIYAKIIMDFSPKAIITYSEFAFSSSILTYYCKKMI